MRAIVLFVTSVLSLAAQQAHACDLPPKSIQLDALVKAEAKNWTYIPDAAGGGRLQVTGKNKDHSAYCFTVVNGPADSVTVDRSELELNKCSELPTVSVVADATTAPAGTTTIAPPGCI